MDHNSEISVLVLPLSSIQDARCYISRQKTEVYHPATQDSSSSSHKQSLSSCNKWGTQEGRLNCSSIINCSSPSISSRLLQCPCCRGSTACTGAAVRPKHHRDPMGTTCNPAQPQKVSVQEKGTCNFTQSSVKVLEAWTECFLCNKLFPLHSRYLSIRSLSGERSTPRKPTENQMLTHQQKLLHFSLVLYVSITGPALCFPCSR